MFLTFLMTKEKCLRKLDNVTPTIYHQENNADSILLICPTEYGENSLLSSSVTLNYTIKLEQPIIVADEETNEEKEINEIGDSILITFSDVPYIMKNDEYFLQATIPISKNFTAYIGTIDFWIEIHGDEENKLIAKTNCISVDIQKHKEIIDYIPEQTYSLLDDYMIKIQQMLNTCNITLEKAMQEADRATKAANLILDILEKLEGENDTE